MRNKILFSYQWAVGLGLLLFSGLLTSCKHDDLTLPRPNENIRPAADFIRNNYDFRLFSAALEYTGLAAELNGKGPFTVIAPTDQAFNALGIVLPGDFARLNKDSLRFSMAYHILPQRLYSADVPVNGIDVRYETLAGKSLYASVAMFSPGSTYPVNLFYFGGSPLLNRDVVLSNGVFHSTSKVQKYFPETTVQAWLAARPTYSIFVEGLKKFGLWDELSRPGRFTVFAPDNKAFTDAGITAADIAALNPDDYIGARLFGTYILYDRQYFVSDKIIFGVINGESRYTYKLRNDIAELALIVYEDFGVGRNLYYELSASLKPVGSGWPIFLGQVASTIQAWGRMDNLCENGIVHYLPGILITPDQAKK